MAYQISDECINCGVCEQECPVECISAGEGEFEGQYVINEELCTDCGACAAVCPCDAPTEK